MYLYCFHCNRRVRPNSPNTVTNNSGNETIIIYTLSEYKRYNITVLFFVL